MAKPWNKLIVALDLISPNKIKRVLDSLAGRVKKFKVGLIAYTRFGPQVIKWVKERGGVVFLDFKLFDIPSTMTEAAKGFVDLEVWAFTVHLRVGEKSLEILNREITKYAALKKKSRPLIIGVTELTSQKVSLNKVLNLARVAYKSNLDGVVCSVWEAEKIKNEFGLLTITPGIRKVGIKIKDDQERVATVSEALKSKSDYFVVGRPIIGEKDYLKAAHHLLKG